mgnify:CR=1 FL=1
MTALIVDTDVYRIGVTEKIVQVAQDFLVGSSEKNSEDVRIIV